MDNFTEILANPEKYFAHPNEIIQHAKFTPQQKHKLLLQWKNEIEATLHADDENMLASGKIDKIHDKDLEKLAVINAALGDSDQSE